MHEPQLGGLRHLRGERADRQRQRPPPPASGVIKAE
jgi:hypothetical protein